MASTLLERTRESHEEIERLERAVCADFRHEAVTHKERLELGACTISAAVPECTKTVMYLPLCPNAP